MRVKPLGCRVWCYALLGISLIPLVSLSQVQPLQEAPKRFTFADVHRRAADLARQPFKPDPNPLPDRLRELTYDQYRDIRFRTDLSLWREEKLPFEIQFFHRGYLYQESVLLNAIIQQESYPIPYNPAFFDFGRNTLDTFSPELGFSGFRIHYPLHRDDYYDEVAVFQGASYFRAVGQHQGYGLSARGLAIDTGLMKAEEFPVFREFWLVKPTVTDVELNVYALLDSRRVTGAYQLVIKPGYATTIEVKAHLFMRDAVEKLGIAPLTSMFFHGENTETHTDDFRPEVHDSDGLLIQTGQGEWIWRPLHNATRLRISSFQDHNPKGFGLRQRDRQFEHYQDLESAFEKRPSVWVEPLEEWGKGVIQLIEIPSNSEKYDNIVAFWIPEKPTEAGQEWVFHYRLYFELEESHRRGPSSKTLSTRIGAGGTVDLDPAIRKFVVDFGGPSLASLPPNTPVEAMVSTNKGLIKNIVTQPNPFTKGWRVVFELLPNGNEPTELRCFLKSGDHVLTETWSYQWTRP